NRPARTLAACRAPGSRPALRAPFRRWRRCDWVAAQRVTSYITSSRATQARVKAYFGRESHVVYPPVEPSRFAPGEVGDRYLLLSELMPHKQLDLAVHAFNRLGRPLLIGGDGPDYRRLRRPA